MVPEYFISCKLRTPISEKEYKTISKPILTITKTFPAFIGDVKSEEINFPGTNTAISEPKLKPTIIPNNNPKPTIEIVKKPTVEIKKTSNETQPPVTNSGEPLIKASSFSPMELDDPDNIELINSLKILEYKSKEVDAQIAKIEGRPPQNLRNYKLKLSVKFKMLKENIEEGRLTLEGYLNILVAQYQKDLKLMKYFKQIKNEEKFAIVDLRTKLMKEEIDEGVKLVKKK